MVEKSNLKETLSKIVSESLAEDAVNSCENILSCPDIFTKFINSPTKDVEEKIENIIVDINSIIKQNYAFAFINGARKAIEGDYGRSYLFPTVKDDCEYVKNKDFAFIYRFGDNDFGEYFTSVIEEYAKRYKGLLSQINLYNNIGGSKLMTDSYIEEIDALITKHLDSWELYRINKVDLAILRISVYPLLYQKDLHPSIVINEAVDISKEFGSDDSYKFVNAVLDNIKKELGGK